MIEFEDLLTEQEAAFLRDETEAVLARRRKCPKEALATEPPQGLFEAGRDLWRDSSDILSLISQRKVVEIASRLVKQKPLRLGFDQLFPPAATALEGREDSYHHFLRKKSSLAQVCSLQGVACGLILRLDPLSHASLLQEPCFPQKTANGVFLHPDAVMDWPYLLGRGGSRFYLVVYAQPVSLYVLNRSDPQAKALKNFGYSVGDRLKDTLNPIVFR